MVFGVWFRNEKNNAWQLDDVHPVKSYRTKGSVSPIVQTKPQWFSVSFTADAQPWIALRGVNCHAAVEYVVKSGSTYTFHYFAVLATSGASITYYIFDKCPTAPRTTGWGFELYNDAGETIVSDAYPPVRFVDIILDPAGTDFTGPFTYPSGRTYATVAPACLWQNRTEVEEPTFGAPIRTDFYDMGGWRWNGTTMTGAMAESDQAAAHSYSDSTGYPPTLIVVDVTNL